MMTQKMVPQAQYDAACELLVRANARSIQLHDQLKAAEAELRTMKARTKPTVPVFQTFEAPDTGRLVIEEQRRRGQR